MGLIISTSLSAQNMSEESHFSFREIPEYDNVFTSGKIAARMIDGLGFRFYWSKEGLTRENMDFRPSAEIRSIEETIEHIHSMTFLIMEVLGLDSQKNPGTNSAVETRNETLSNLHLIREKLLISNDHDFENFKRESKDGNTIPFWNYINGPIEDCVWHCGQIASFRRLAGNPISSNISLFSGKLRD